MSEFEKWWDNWTSKVGVLHSPKEYAQILFAAGQAAEREACAMLAFSTSAYKAIRQRGEK